MTTLDQSPLQQDSIKAPLFLIGTGRSGSTIVFEAVARHEQLAWITSHDARFPNSRIVALHHYGRRLPVIDRIGFSGQKRSRAAAWVRRLQATPSEGYPKWETLAGTKFRYGFLRNVQADADEAERVRAFVRTILRRQGKHRWICKITGPTRMLYLRSIFPNAQFVYVHRDPQAVVESMLRATFWKSERPRWPDGLDPKWIELWRRHGGGAAALAAVQVAAIGAVYEEEKSVLEPAAVKELAYEEFVRRPLASLEEILAFADLSASPRAAAYVATPGRYENQRRPSTLLPHDRNAVGAILGIDGGHATADSASVLEGAR